MKRTLLLFVAALLIAGCDTAGPAGPAGTAGAKGTAGEQGIAGQDGANGANGANGADGADGIDGFARFTRSDFFVEDGAFSTTSPGYQFLGLHVPDITNDVVTNGVVMVFMGLGPQITPLPYTQTVPGRIIVISFVFIEQSVVISIQTDVRVDWADAFLPTTFTVVTMENIAGKKTPTPEEVAEYLMQNPTQ